MRYVSQGLSSLETFCFITCLPKPVSQKAYAVINLKIGDLVVMGHEGRERFFEKKPPYRSAGQKEVSGQ
ncbi:hypothetical protein NPIL_65501 [Nephila pilipes]|uniref:Uncharacterized protein n=1 Tax=Nephila pilipes TaxID=299642 RepID=A0A8X6TNN8_NEPPI|nr:hypothetical protein NPIL_65501 [Nephila pilipes]